jgi:hypothetical protein
MKDARRLALGVAVLAGMGGLSGCATSEKVQAKQLGDSDMSCEQLAAESRRLDDTQRRVDQNRGATGTNVAAALFWLPGLAYTYYDAGQADQLISQRRSWLTELYEKKRCTQA